MQVIFETRFSYFGSSGWRSPASGDPEILFDPERLERRFALFERITLPSLAAQTDPGFRHVVLTSGLMPLPFRRRLVELTRDTLGSDRATVLAKRPRSAGRIFQQHIAQEFAAEGRVAQVVLDDDDAVSADFVGICRAEALAPPSAPEAAIFLSFPEGCSLVFAEDGRVWLSRRHTPFTNLGLTLVAPPATRLHPFMTSHRMIGERHPSRLIERGRPFYLRSVHDDNDSRAMHDKTPIEGAELGQVLRYFPFLANDLAFRGQVGANVAE